MSRTAGRSKEQTRRQILDAAAVVVRERGVGASLDEVAEAAGVSKGGLIYHFGSKDALLLALTGALLDDFRAAVHAARDEEAATEPVAGRLTRAYVRVSCDPEVDDRAVRENLVLIAQLITDDRVAALAAEDSRRWHDDLTGDGLPREVCDLVVSAADGVGMAAVWGGGTDKAALAGLRERLLTITRDPGLWRALAGSAPIPADAPDTR